MVVKKTIEILKAQVERDIYTTRPEAESRAADMGLEGAHVEIINGQAYYMPGEDHEDYLEYYQGEYEYEEESEESDDQMERALRAVVAEIIGKAEYQGETVSLNKPRRTSGGNKKFEVFVMDGGKVKRVTFGDPNMEIRRDDPEARANFRARHNCDSQKDKTSAAYWSCRMWEAGTSVSEMTKADVEGQILKTDEEQRLVYGWASVITEKGVPIVDRQGDVIEADTLVKAVNDFMEHVRVGKEMHDGEPIGRVIHSLPLTKEIGESLGIRSDREGWVVAFKVYDDAVWKKVKDGELRAFSIGGRATREKIEQ